MKKDPAKIEKLAVKAGTKASCKRHHLVSEAELLALKVQVMPSSARLALILIGLALIIAAFIGMPLDGSVARGLEAIGGILLTLFRAFGIRRTLSSLFDHLPSGIDVGEFASSAIESIADAVGSIVDL